MAHIGYEKELDMVPLFDELKASFNQGGTVRSVDVGQILKTLVADAKKCCDDALAPTKQAHEQKTQSEGHPFKGKTLKWKPSTSKLLVRDGKLIMQVTQDYEVQ